MRILQANKYFYRRGGADIVFLDTIDGLKERGHEVAEMSVIHPLNLPSDYSSFFVNTQAELTSEKTDFFTGVGLFKHFISSPEVDKKLRALAMDTKPQVAHLHNTVHQLSATIFKTLKKLNIPIVVTVHDLQPMCPNHRMYVRNQICEKCFKHKYYNCFLQKCIGDSRAKSASASLEAYYYYTRGIWNMADILICPSKFMMDKLIAWRFDKKKLRLLHNFVSAPNSPLDLGDSIVYLGRLHFEKGIRVLVNSLRKLRGCKTLIAGDGPDEKWVEVNIKQNSLTDAIMVGRVRGKRWDQIMKQARVVVAPSLVYENCPLTLLEACAHGRLVVASDLGGVSEIIENSKTGFLAKPNDPDSLAIMIGKAMNIDDQEAQTMANRARDFVVANYSKEKYFIGLEEIYKEVIK
ncbi:MAG: glycosyltransferase [bacterium]